MTLMQPKCISASCGHTRCAKCEVYQVAVTELNESGEKPRKQKKSGGFNNPVENAALQSRYSSTKPQYTASTASKSCNNTLDVPPTHAAYFQAGHDIQTTFVPHLDTQADQQSLNLPDTRNISDHHANITLGFLDCSTPATASDIHSNSEHHANITPGLLDFSSCDFDSVIEDQAQAFESVTASGGPRCNDATFHPSVAVSRDELKDRLLSFHPPGAEDSDSESSSTSSSTSTPTADKILPRSSDKQPRDGGQKRSTRTRKRRVKRSKISSEHTLPHLRASSPERQGFACPFWKKNPLRHRKCFKLEGYKRIRDVKQHLRRKHLMPVYCQRCGMQFKIEDDLNKHLQAVAPCQRGDFEKPEGITGKEKDLLAKHTARNGGFIAQWENIWDIVFPNLEGKKPDSPYVYTDQSEDLSSFIEFIQYQGRPVLETTSETMFIVDPVIEVINQIHSLWRSQRGLHLSIQPPRPALMSSHSLSDNDTVIEAHDFNYPLSMATMSTPFAPWCDFDTSYFIPDMAP
ncbi:hypothetical protein VSDG_08698 [Cytospora chrysosperma]|uniref:C2H2-type domain-containing protein n=1 Tax=Cytospora chrysosperma TaxID=252740 RepID=A0A423VEI5_CYTCH|nr:hypothetical protein VSDG_08698 [Valsa sordida]